MINFYFVLGVVAVFVLTWKLFDWLTDAGARRFQGYMDANPHVEWVRKHNLFIAGIKHRKESR